MSKNNWNSDYRADFNSNLYKQTILILENNAK